MISLLYFSLFILFLCYKGTESLKLSSNDDYVYRLFSRNKRFVDSSLYLNTAPQTAMVCQKQPNRPGFSSCPDKGQECNQDKDCQWLNSRSYCACDLELCGTVCVSQDFECNRLAVPRNGNLDYLLYNVQRTTEQRKVSTRAVYSCNPGYILDGNGERFCQANGQYSGTEPQCLAADAEKCSPPPSVPHTIRHPEDDKFEFRAGARFTYACAPGYTADRPGLNITAICLKGRWNMKSILCTIISCGAPGNLTYGRHVNNIYTFKHKVAYFCNEGYDLLCAVPSENMRDCQVRTCQANGMWSGSRPVCKPILCPTLRAPENGEITESLNTVNSVVQYSCHSGYRLVGSTSRLCRPNGDWDGAEPHCQVQDCGTPVTVPNAHPPKFSGTRYGEVATYHCKADTTFEGENSGKVVCGSSGKWTPDPPKCRLHCKAPSILSGKALIGKVNGPEAIGMVASDTTLWIQCNPAYQLKQILYPRCDNGTWTKIPKCVPRDCNQRPPIVQSGIARFYGIKHLDEVRYQCYVGYEIIKGSSTLICQFGKWHGEKPRCSKKKCPWLNPGFGIKIWLLGSDGITKNPWTRPETLPDHEEVISFECDDKKMKLVGHTHAICISGGWSPPGTPKCVEKKHKNIPMDWFFYGSRG